MSSRLAADLIVLLHFSYILFVVFGGLLVLRWPKLAWLHLPAVVWGAVVELAGFICPLTPLENDFRAAAGEQDYNGGFIEQYLFPIIYPSGLTRDIQVMLGLGVIAINVVIYLLLIRRRRART
ncbi:MAG: DUF2784 domain-containing protein [Desulfuromonas sp.]|nr:MAG: DUF2784 domain-containing protein [Desulfuromonas sp.]